MNITDIENVTVTESNVTSLISTTATMLAPILFNFTTESLKNITSTTKKIIAANTTVSPQKSSVNPDALFLCILSVFIGVSLI